jgi:hypothetical protein
MRHLTMGLKRSEEDFYAVEKGFQGGGGRVSRANFDLQDRK